mmetsp:Transcript_1908/g.6964  ORF Transcript_1908/g.6964 Transcript_1908/m.6964 type:complete len:241 (-) Transcript_1908:29-751(-)
MPWPTAPLPPPQQQTSKHNGPSHTRRRTRAPSSSNGCGCTRTLGWAAPRRRACGRLFTLSYLWTPSAEGPAAPPASATSGEPCSAATTPRQRTRTQPSRASSPAASRGTARARRCAMLRQCWPRNTARGLPPTRRAPHAAPRASRGRSPRSPSTQTRTRRSSSRAAPRATTAAARIALWSYRNSSTTSNAKTAPSPSPTRASCRRRACRTAAPAARKRTSVRGRAGTAKHPDSQRQGRRL